MRSRYRSYSSPNASGSCRARSTREGSSNGAPWDSMLYLASICLRSDASADLFQATKPLLLDGRCLGLEQPGIDGRAGNIGHTHRTRIALIQLVAYLIERRHIAGG